MARHIETVSPEQARQQQSVAADVAKGAGSGVARGVVGIPGMAGDLIQLGNRGAVWANRQLYGEESAAALARSQQEQAQSMPNIPGTAVPLVPGSEQVIDAAARTGGDVGQSVLKYEPTTTAGRVAQVAGEFTGGAALTAGAGAWAKAGTKAERALALGKELLAQGIAPGVASEVAGQVADNYFGEDFGTAVRLATGMATSVAGSASHNVSGPPRVTEVPGVGDVRSSAAANVGRGIQEGGGPAAVGSQLEQVGAGARLADATPGLRGQTEQLYIEPGRSQQTVRGFLNERLDQLRGQDTALTRTLDTIINPRSANFAEEAADMRQARRQRADQLYGEARQQTAGQQIPTARTQALIDATLPSPDPATGARPPLHDHEEVLARVRERIGQRGDFDFLLNEKRNLDAEIEKRVRSGGYTQPLREARDMLDSELESAARRPNGTSAYGEARRAYREDSGILDAQGAGRDFLKANQSADEFRLYWRDLSDTERQAFRLGLRESIGGSMDVAVNDFNTGTNRLATNQNRAKLETVLGAQEAGQLQDRVEGLRRQRGTVQGIQNQSATAGRIRGRETIEDPTAATDIPPLSRIQTVGGVASAAGEWGLKKILGRRQAEQAAASNADQAAILTQDIMQLPAEQRMAALERLEEVYRTKGVRRGAANPALLALQAAYQTVRSQQNRGP